MIHITLILSSSHHKLLNFIPCFWCYRFFFVLFDKAPSGCVRPQKVCVVLEVQDLLMKVST